MCYQSERLKEAGLTVDLKQQVVAVMLLILYLCEIEEAGIGDQVQEVSCGLPYRDAPQHAQTPGAIIGSISYMQGQNTVGC